MPSGTPDFPYVHHDGLSKCYETSQEPTFTQRMNSPTSNLAPIFSSMNKCLHDTGIVQVREADACWEAELVCGPGACYPPTQKHVILSQNTNTLQRKATGNHVGVMEGSGGKFEWQDFISGITEYVFIGRGGGMSHNQ